VRDKAREMLSTYSQLLADAFRWAYPKPQDLEEYYDVIVFKTLRSYWPMVAFWYFVDTCFGAFALGFVR